MRSRLAEYQGRRKRFYGTVVRWHHKTTSTGKRFFTILLKDIFTIDGRQVADHIWLEMKPEAYQGALRRGDRLAFDAQGASYLKRYKVHVFDEATKKVSEEIQWKKDYMLRYPTLFKRLKKPATQRIHDNG
jgi:hypothetical protein